MHIILKIRQLKSDIKNNFAKMFYFYVFIRIFAEKYKTLIIMKRDIHPKEYKLVVFKDTSNDYAFLTRSTATSKDKILWEDGNEYPLIKLEISHTSHPFYTGKMKFVDTAGRVDKFRTRYKQHLK